MTIGPISFQSSGERQSRKAMRSAPPCLGRAAQHLCSAAIFVLLAFGGLFNSTAQDPPMPPPEAPGLPLRVTAAQRFLAQRGWPASRARLASAQSRVQAVLPQSTAGTASTATWQPVGPLAVSTASYGLVTGRVSSIALDPIDSTGNRVYIGTTGGGVWLSQNAATASTANVQFAPLTDTVGAMRSALYSSISIGAHHSAAWGHRRCAGRDRRPKRCARLLLWRGDSALDRWRQHLESDSGHSRSGVGLCRRRLLRIRVEHRASAACSGSGVAGS